MARVIKSRNAPSAAGLGLGAAQPDSGTDESREVNAQEGECPAFRQISQNFQLDWMTR